MTKIQLLSLSFPGIQSLTRHLTTNHNKLVFKKTRFIIQAHFDSAATNTYHLTIQTTKANFPAIRDLVLAHFHTLTDNDFFIS